MINRGRLVVPLLALLVFVFAMSLPSGLAQERRESLPSGIWHISLGRASKDRPLYVEIHSPASLDLIYAEPSRLRTFTAEGELILHFTYLPRMRLDSYWHAIITEAEPAKTNGEGGYSFKGANACLVESMIEQTPIIGIECVGEDPTGALLRVKGELFVQYIIATNTVLIRPKSAVTS